MKAITLWQPWASLVAIGVKTIETRAWPAPRSLIGQRIAIHAAARLVPAFAPIALELGEYEAWSIRARSDGHHLGPHPGGSYMAHNGEMQRLTLGAVICTALLVECVPMIPWDQLADAPYIRCGFEGRQLPLQLRASNEGTSMRVEDQRPYGDFRPGRWAWLLDDVEQLVEPVPATGRQRLWDIDI
jgi:hypothetical protein